MSSVGVLALQGDFAEHITLLERVGADAVEVRLPHQLEGLSGIIIPGGESTTIGKLAVSYGLMEPLIEFGETAPIWGTCAGAIFLSRDAHREQPLLGLMDITVQRNAFGRQLDSFEQALVVDSLKDGHEPFPAIFIRAPIIESIGNDVDVLARLESDDGEGAIVAVRQGNLLATSFHPELTEDARFHAYFLQMIEEAR